MLHEKGVWPYEKMEAAMCRRTGERGAAAEERVFRRGDRRRKKRCLALD